MIIEYYGYAGTILHLNLTNGSVKKEPLNIRLAKEFIGGWGLNMRLAYSYVKPGIDPLSPDNPVIFGVGPLVGTPAPSAAKVVATTKLPQTKAIVGAVSGSRKFGLMFKNAGYDHLVITGKSESPVYIKIIDDNVEICSADHLWGKKDIYETTEELENEHRGGVVAIGQAGENLVDYSLSIVDKTSHLGRGGFGAVMGSKNLKAVVAFGTGRVAIRKKTEFMKRVRKIHEEIKKMTGIEEIQKMGVSMAGWDTLKESFNEGVWSKKKWNKLYGIESFLKARGRVIPCTTCIMPCKISHKVKQGEFAGLETETGHFSNIAALGQRLEIEDFRRAIKLMDILNRVGMCYMTYSGLVDFITRLYEKRVITKRHTGGLELKRDFETYVMLADKIVHREGFGDLLASGWREVSKRLGIDSSYEYIEGRGQVKGIDAIHDARFRTFDTLSITQIVNFRATGAFCYSVSASHAQPIESIRKNCKKMGVSGNAVKRIFDPSNPLGFSSGRLTKHCEDAYAVYSSLGTCAIYAILGIMNVKVLSDFYSAATGAKVTPRMLQLSGERAFNVFKALNVREGFARKDDEAPEVWLKPRKTPDGTVTMMDYYGRKVLSRNDVHKILDEYYDERGWELDKGIPTKEKLAELDLEEIGEDLEKPGLCRPLKY